MMKYLLAENITHGNSSFPVCLYDIDFTCDYKQILPCHWHDEYEILYISKGTAVFSIEDQSYEVSEGQSLFVNGGELHSAISSDPDGVIFHALVFNLSFLNSGSNDLCQNKYISPLMLKQYFFPHQVLKDKSTKKLLNPIIYNMFECMRNKNPGYELFVKGSLMLLISLFSQNNLLVGSKSMTSHFNIDRSDMIKKVIDYIGENYAKKIYINEMASFLSMNRYNFCRFFKKHTGMTPIEYLNFHRINEACKLLQSGKCNVTEAALQTGFENMSYFTRTLKKYKNTIPSKLMRV